MIYELGYCSGVFDGYYEENEDGDIEAEPVIMIKEKSIDMRDLSDLLGVEYLEYTNGSIDTVFGQLRKALNKLYEELGGEDDE